MKSNQLNQILSVVRHTGDRVVVVDPENDEVVVLMLFSEYKALLSAPTQLGSDDVFDLGQNNEENLFDPTDEVPVFQEKNEFGGKNKTQTAIKNSDEKFKNEEYLEFNDEDWGKQDTGFLAEESLKDVPEDEVEEKFYLEPIEP